jgi:phage-related protein
MSDNVVGTAYVVIRALTNKVNDDIKRGVEKGIKESEPDLHDAGEDLGTDIGDGINDGVENETRKKLGPRLESAFKDVFTRLRGSSGKEGEGLGQRFGRAFGQSLEKLTGSIPSLLFAGFTALVPLVAGGIQLISSGLAGLVALSSTLGPALTAGAGVGAAAFFGLFSSIMLVVKAFTLVSDAQGRFFLAVGPATDAWRKSIEGLQKEMFSRLAPALYTLTDTLLPIVSDQLIELGKIAGNIGLDFAELSKSVTFQGNFAQTMSTNNFVFKQFGEILIDVIDSFFILTATVSPFVREFAKWVADLVSAGRAQLTLAQASGRLFDFFDRGVDLLKQWSSLLWDLVVGLFNIFKIGGDAGGVLLDRMSKSLEKFREWTESIAGKKSIAQWFEDALPVIREFNKLVAAVFKSFAGAGTTEGTVNFLRALREDLLPALIPLFQQLSESGPAFTEAIVNIAGALSAVAQTGAIGTFAETIGKIAEAITALVELPVVGPLLGWAIALAGIAKALSFIPGFMKLLTFAFTAFGVVIDVLATVALPLIAPLFEALTVAAGTLAAALGISISAFLAIAAAVAAVVAAVVILYFKWEPFRKLVDATARIIKDAVVAAFNFLWDVLQAVGSYLADTFGPILSKIWDVLQTVGEFVGKVLVAYFQAWWAVVSTVFNFIASIAVPILQKIWDIFVSVGKFVGGTLLKAFDALWGVISFVFRAAIAIISKTAIIIWLAIQPVLKRVGEAFRTVWQVVRVVWNLIKEAVSTAMDVIREVVSAVIGRVKDIWNTLSSFISSVWRSITDRVGNALEPIFNVWQRIYDKIKGLWDGFASFISGIWEAVAATIQGAFEGIKGWINDNIIGPVNDTIGSLNKLPGPDVPSIPYLAKGGIVSPAAGGTLAMIAEAGRPERVEPLDSRGLSKRDYEMLRAVGGTGGGKQFVFNVKTERTWTPLEAAQLVGRAEVLYGP